MILLKTKKTLLKLSVIGSALFVIAINSHSLAETDLRANIQVNDQAIRIKVQNVEENLFLFLPSCANEKNTLISFNSDNHPIEAQFLPIDFSSVEVDNGQGSKHYTIEINENHDKLRIMKSDNISSIHMEFDREDILPYLHQSKDNKATGVLTMIDANGNAIVRSECQIKGRGNGTWVASGEKRPYNIKLSEKAELIPGAGKAKKWCLLSNNQFEKTGIANYVTLEAYNEMEGAYTVQLCPVDLYINGEYRGEYLLTEKVEVGKQRINIDETKNEEIDDSDRFVKYTDHDEFGINVDGIEEYQYIKNATNVYKGGYLLEIDNLYYENESSWFTTRNGVHVVIKSPEQATFVQLREIASYIQGFEDALYSKTGYNAEGVYYENFIDVDSLVKKFCLNTFIGNLDYMLSSEFIIIDRNKNEELGKLIFAPEWDCDNVFSVSKDELLPFNIVARWDNTTFWATQLLRRGDFLHQAYNYGCNSFADITDRIHDNIGWFSLLVSSSQSMNGILWDVDYIKQYDVFLQKYNERMSSWDKIWSQDRLLGCSITIDEGGLVASVDGAADKYQWYVIDNSWPNKAVIVEGACDQRFIPENNGQYFVAVKGKNVGCCRSADRFITDNNRSMAVDAVIIQEEIEIYSEPVQWTGDI